MEKEYDFVIIGSGLGGLYSAAMLAKEGYSVIVLEKNRQLGGCLQIFSREKVIFDTGVHYLGGLDKGQNLYRYFDYLGLMDMIKFKKLDMDGYDQISFSDDPVQYKVPQGYENFINYYAEFFPEERAGIELFCAKMIEVCRKLPLYNVEVTSDLDFMQFVLSDKPVDEVIASCVKDPALRRLLAGNNALYAGIPGVTPFYVHALVINSYIESAYKCEKGGAQISLALSKIIRQHHGQIRAHANVKKIETDDEKATCVVLESGEKIHGKKFISAIHPTVTLQLLGEDNKMIRKAYRSRINGLKNSVSAFIVYVVLKEKSIPTFNHNKYYVKCNDAWNNEIYTEEEWPKSVAIFTTPSKDPDYCEGLIIMSYMQYDDVKEWEDTFNTVAHEDDRSESYQQFKRDKAQKVLDLAEEKIPGIRDNMKSYYTSTPLTMRDYIGGEGGSLYGIIKDHRDPLKTLIPPQTRIPNVFLTGQNTVMHGVLGVIVGAVKTCNEILGNNYLITKIKESTLYSQEVDESKK